MPTSVGDLCTQYKVTIKELTARTDLDSQRILAIMLGRWTPSPEERHKVAEAFDLAVDDIAWGHKTPIQHIYGHGPG